MKIQRHFILTYCTASIAAFPALANDQKLVINPYPVGAESAPAIVETAPAPVLSTTSVSAVPSAPVQDVQADVVSPPPAPVFVVRNLEGKDLYEEIRRQTGEAETTSPPLADDSIAELEPLAPLPVTAAASPVSSMSPAPMMSNAASNPMPEHKCAPMQTAQRPAPTVSPAPAPKQPEPAMSFEAARGQKVSAILADWGTKAGVEILWNANRDYPVMASLEVNAPYEEAVEILLSQFRNESARPIGTLYKDGSRRILVVDGESQG